MDSPEEGLSIQPMKLKVLYSFDKEHKNNCLARCPNVLQIRTAFIDDNNQIGIIDLKTCIQTVVAASPELVSKLEDDFTIYAYDYSEPDTPLVGQGMLSWALTAPQSNIEDDEGSMITGRVTRNLMGVFSKSAQQTLEVKLRLVPVPSNTQADYLKSLQKYQQMSSVIGQGFDAQSWTSFVQNNPSLLSRSIPTPPAPESQASPIDRPGLEAMQRMLGGGASPRDTSDMSAVESGMPRAGGSRPGSRSGTPMMQSGFNGPLRRSDSHVSRPSSRNSVREASMQPPVQNSHQRRDSFNSGYYSGDEGVEEGPARKRAKIVQADWTSKPNLNIERQPDSLRVAASTAASVRLHRPMPVNPLLQVQQSSNEEPIRPPTPISRQSRAPLPRARTVSTLRAGATVPDSSSPPPLPTGQQFAAVTSPEDTRAHSAGSTPANMPSSPPPMHTRTPAPSSPVLPPMPKVVDSGFMSGGNFDLDNYFTDNALLNFDDDFPGTDMNGPEFNFDPFTNNVTFPNNTQGPQTHPVSGEDSQSPSAPVPASAAIQQNGSAGSSTKRSRPRAPSSRPASRAGIHSPKLVAAPYPRARQLEQERNGQFGQNLAQIPASDPAGPSLHRSQTWAGEMMSDVPMSDMAEPMMTSANSRRSRPKRFGKEQTAKRLESAIQGGEMPPFCDNCGTIETPAWRKAWARIFESGWNTFQTGLEKDDFLATEVIDRDEEGKVIKFKAFKIVKSASDDDRDFLSVNLCNPCGLWLHKQKCMRPEARWNKNQKDPKEKKKRPSRPRSQRKAAQKKRGDDPTKSDGPASSPEGSDGVAASEQDVEDDNEIEDGRQQALDDDAEPDLPPMPSQYRASSAEPSAGQQTFRPGGHDAVVRRVQSSPIRHDAVDGQDLTPQPLRRLLFSPEKTKSAALTEVTDNIVRRSPRLNKSVDFFKNTKTPVAEKENHIVGNTDGLDHLFGADDNEELPNPQTPTPTRRSDRILFKTPLAKTPSRKNGEKTPMTFSPAAQRLLQVLKTPKALASNTPIARALFGQQPNANPEMTPFTLQIHQILSDTANMTSPLRGQPGSGSKRQRNAVTDSRGSQKSGTGSNAAFDFPDLPPLNNTSTSSPSSATGALGRPLVDFSEFTNADQRNGHPNDLGLADLMMMDDLELQELLSTDVVMPSSPPSTNDNNTSNNMEAFNWMDDHHQGLWHEMGADSSLQNQDQDPHPMGINELESGRRVSPRKNKGRKSL